MKKLLIFLLFISGVASAQTFDPLSLQRMPQQRIVGRTGPTTGNATFLKLHSSFIIRNDSLILLSAGIPGGSNTQLQYNNSGAFGGISGATTNGTVVTLTSPVINVTSDATGDMYYRNASGLFTRLPIGTAAQHLTGGTIPVWKDTAAGGSLPSLGNQGELLQVSNGAAAWKYDTTTMVTMTGGARFQSDTAAFTDSTLYSSFFWDGNDTLIVTGLKAVMNGGTSDTLGIQITYNDTINVIGTSMFSATLPINSTTVGTSPDADDWTGGAAPFKIPPGNWVWLKTPTVVAGRKPYYLSVSIIGYRKRVN